MSHKIILPDIMIFRSLGVKARNYDIEMPNGDYVHFTENTWIKNVTVIAGKNKNRKIDEIDALLEEFGGSADEWQKVKGIGYGHL